MKANTSDIAAAKAIYPDLKTRKLFEHLSGQGPKLLADLRRLMNITESRLARLLAALVIIGLVEETKTEISGKYYRSFSLTAAGRNQYARYCNTNPSLEATN